MKAGEVWISAKRSLGPREEAISIISSRGNEVSVIPDGSTALTGCPVAKYLEDAMLTAMSVMMVEAGKHDLAGLGFTYLLPGIHQSVTNIVHRNQVITILAKVNLIIRISQIYM